MRALTIVIAALVTLLASAGYAVQTNWMRDAVLDRLLRFANDNTKGTWEVGAYGGRLLTGVALRDVTLRFDGREVIAVSYVDASISVPALVFREIRLTRLQIRDAKIDGREISSRWNLVEAWRLKSSADTKKKKSSGEQSWSFWADNVEIRRAALALQGEGGVQYGASVTRATGAFRWAAGEISMHELEAQLALQTPASRSIALTAGAIVFPGKSVIRFDGLDVLSQGSNVRLTGAWGWSRTQTSNLDSRGIIAAGLLYPRSPRTRFHASLQGTREEFNWALGIQLPASANLSGKGKGTIPLRANGSSNWAAVSTSFSVAARNVRPEQIWRSFPQALRPALLTFNATGEGQHLALPNRRLNVEIVGKPTLIAANRIDAYHATVNMAEEGVKAITDFQTSLGRAQSNVFFSARRQDYSGNARVTTSRLAKILGKAWPGSVTAKANFSGRGFRPGGKEFRGRMLVSVQNAVVGEYQIRRARIPLEWRGAQITTTGATMQTNAGDLRARGSVGLRRDPRISAAFLLRSDQPARLAAAWPRIAKSMGTGSVMAQGKLAGTLGRLSGNLFVAGRALNMGPVTAPVISMEAEALDVDVRRGQGRLQVVLAAQNAIAKGLLARRIESAFSVSRTDQKIEAQYYATMVTIGAESKIEGRVFSNEVTTTIFIDALRATLAGYSWSNAGTAAIVVGAGQVQVANLHWRSGRQRLRAAGSFREGIDVTIDGGRIEQLRGWWAPLRDARGALLAHVRVTGTLRRPQILGRVEITKGAWGNAPFDSVKVTSQAGGRQMVINVLIVEQGGRGRADAEMHIASEVLTELPSGSAPITGQVRVSNVSLQWVQPWITGVSGVAGQINGRAALGGVLNSPALVGAFEVRNGRFRVPRARVVYSNLKGTLKFQGQRAVIPELSAESKNGRVVLTGAWPWHPGSRGMQLRLQCTRCPVFAARKADVTVDADLKATGTFSRPLVTGLITVDEFIYHPAERSERELEPLEFAVPGVHVILPAGADVPELKKKPPGIAVRAVLRVEVAALSNTWIRGGDANIELRGRLLVHKASGEESLRYTGIIETLRGFYRVQGRRFAIERGRAVFRGEPVFNPLLDITLSYSAVEYIVDARVTGTARVPIVTLSSRPELSQSDILAVLVFGRVSGQLASSQRESLREETGQLVASIAAGRIRESVGRQLGFESVDIIPGTEDGQGAEIGVGRYLGSQIYVQLLQGLRSAGGTELRLEYYFSRHWLVQSQASPTGSGVDVFWHVLF